MENVIPGRSQEANSEARTGNVSCLWRAPQVVEPQYLGTWCEEAAGEMAGAR